MITVLSVGNPLHRGATFRYYINTCSVEGLQAANSLCYDIEYNVTRRTSENDRSQDLEIPTWVAYVVGVR